VWLDKGCINQQAISASLACLPLYLFGCNELLVMCGETYASRLWCVMELFTYLRVSDGNVDKMTVRPILSDADANTPANALHAQQRAMRAFRAFECAKAQCYDPKDREHLLSVVESGFGSFDTFDGVVRQLFVALLKRRLGAAAWQQASRRSLMVSALQHNSGGRLPV
jgi:hypothetical protein